MLNITLQLSRFQETIIGKARAYLRRVLQHDRSYRKLAATCFSDAVSTNRRAIISRPEYFPIPDYFLRRSELPLSARTGNRGLFQR